MAQRQLRSHNRGGKRRKHGRMLKKPAYKRYLAEDRRTKNKARRIARYMKKFPNWRPTNLSDKISAYVKRYLE